MQNQEPAIDISQIIGMIIALVAVLYAFGSGIYDIFVRKKRKTPDWPGTLEEQEEDDDEEELRREGEERLRKREEEEHEDLLEREEEVRFEERRKHAKSWVKPEEKYVFHSRIEDLHPATSIDERKLDIRLRTGDDLVNKRLTDLAGSPYEKKKKRSPIHDLATSLDSKKKLIIASEIIRPPVGLRKRDEK